MAPEPTDGEQPGATPRVRVIGIADYERSFLWRLTILGRFPGVRG